MRWLGPNPEQTKGGSTVEGDGLQLTPLHRGLSVVGMASSLFLRNWASNRHLCWHLNGDWWVGEHNTRPNITRARLDVHPPSQAMASSDG
mmetsp:Transcript_417/g.1004  ORF Transcript_417/g.1004 Transcript_417/m.1004 type:complete len:90 (-) Transcript_417:27-296(-)